MTATIEEVRNFWDQRPCNIRHSTEPIGTLEFFEAVEKRKYFVEPHIPLFAQFDRWQGKRVLEVGCGIGTDTINFARAGAHVTAVDLSIKSLDICEQRIHQFGLSDRIKLHKANCEELSDVICPEPYDLIYSFGVIHHTPNPKRAIAELAKYADSETTLKLMLYATYSIKSLQMLIGRVTCEAQPGVPVAYTYTKRGIAELLHPHFRLTSAKKDHIFPWKIPEYIRYEYKMALPWRWLPSRAFRILERMFGWHWLIEGKLRT
jgi:SAM-dependent methyltransferase